MWAPPAATAVASVMPVTRDGGGRVGGGAVAELPEAVVAPAADGAAGQPGAGVGEPAVTAVAVLMPVTATGVEELVVVPLPSRPKPL